MCRRTQPGEHWIIGNMANSLGHCLIVLQHFSEAEALLLEAHAIFEIAQGAPPDRPARNISVLIDLYDAWHAVEPGQGHDRQAAEWRARLAEWQASTQPATQPATQPVTAPAGS
jgi:hypothetical protein